MQSSKHWYSGCSQKLLSSVKNRGRSEGYEKWNKEKYTGNQQWKEGNWIQVNVWEQKEETNIQPEQNEETRIEKNEERLRNLWDHFKCLNILMVGVPEEEEEEQENKNLFEQIMKENFPNLAKEIDMQVREAQRVPKKLDLRRNTPWYT